MRLFQPLHGLVRPVLLLCLLLLVNLPPALAATATTAAASALALPRFETVGDASTVPQSVVSALAQDQQGLLWIGTGAGLVRHDGYTFRPFRLDRQGRSGGSLGFVRVMMVARDGQLWVGTESDGLVRLDPRSEEATAYRSDPARPEGLSPGTVRSLAEDAEGAIWIGTIGRGLDRLDPRSGRFSHYRKADAALGLADDRIQTLLIDRRGTLWVGSWAGLQRRPRGATRFETVAPALAGQIVTAIHESTDGRIWAGSQQGTLVQLAGDGSAERVLTRPDDGLGSVHDFAELDRQQLWVARGSGIEQRDAEGRLMRRIQHQRQEPAGGLGSNEVRALLRDRAGWIWVGSYGGGLQRHNPADTGIWVRGPESEPGSVFEDASARSLLQLDSGEIWVGTSERGLAVFDEQLRLIGGLPPGQGGFAGRRIGGMAQTRDGRLWVGADAELYELDRQRRVLQRLALGGGRVRRMLAGAGGELWVGTQDGLYRYQQGRLERMTLAGGQALSGDVNALVQGSDGGLWIGTEQGLLRLEAGAQQLQRVRERQGAGLGHPSVLGLLLDSRGRLWVDTADGLRRLSAWDGREAAFEGVATAQGLHGRAFGANLLEDALGRIWTQQCVYDPVTDRIHELTPADGADIGTGWFRSYVQLIDGRMLFGGSKGLLVVDPQRYAPWSYAPPLVVSELRVDGQLRSLGELRQGLLLHPGERRFAIEFAALDFSAPLRSSYAYRLQGYEDEWVNTSANVRIAGYGNLPPGRYTLQVRATNRSGVWSRHELAIPVIVEAAWWQQWWLRSLALAAALAAVAGVVQLRTVVLRRRQAQLEQRVRERTAELETATRALQEASLTDPLTGLRNRRFLTQQIDADVALSLRRHANARQSGQPAPDDADLLFFLIDIDGFKRINDQHGHAAGDAVLQQMRERLQPVFRESDWLVRWGGEEFLIVARGTSRRHAAELAERVRQRVAGQPFRLDDGSPLAVSCSLGFACFPLSPVQAPDWTTTVDLADAALYQAKRSGRNAWVGVTDAGQADAATLAERRGSAAQWLEEGRLSVLRSRDLAPADGAARP